MLRRLKPLKRGKEVLLNTLWKPLPDTNPKTKQRNELRYWVWVFIVAVVIVGGRFLFFEVGGNPFQLPMKARDWTGFGESYDNNVSEVAEKGTETDGKITKKIDKTTTTQKKLQPAKTLWDWMSLLLAPATLAGLGFLFQHAQEQAKRDKEEADKKREADQQLAQSKRDADQQREQALQTYFDQLSALLVDKRLLRNLHDTVPDKKEEESTNSETEVPSDNSDKPASKIDVKDLEIDAEAALNVVKAKTLTLFRLFDNAEPIDMPRKASVLAFLGDTGLLNALALDLSGSDWSEANLKSTNLSNAILIVADLSNAFLYCANLTSADLTSADLYSANISCANLSNAKLISADLSDAILLGVDLSKAKYLTQAQLEGKNPPLLCNVTLPKGINVDPNRDCERLPEVLLERYPDKFETLKEAQDVVDGIMWAEAE